MKEVLSFGTAAPLIIILVVYVALRGAPERAEHALRGAPERAEHALVSSGYSAIRLGGHAWFACSDSDWFARHFQARNPAGRSVEGVVCCGATKSCTVRF